MYKIYLKKNLTRVRTMSLGNEYTLVEKAAIEYFKSLEYSYIDERKLTPEIGENH